MYRVTLKYPWQEDSDFYFDSLQEVREFLRKEQHDPERTTVEKTEGIDVYELLRDE